LKGSTAGRRIEKKTEDRTKSKAFNPKQMKVDREGHALRAAGLSGSKSSMATKFPLQSDREGHDFNRAVKPMKMPALQRLR
jgi:hypothetical protein